MKKYITLAKESGFSGAAIINVSDLIIIPDYRHYCEENLCGMYGINPACPPECGTVESMRERINKYQYALILQTTAKPKNIKNATEQKSDKNMHNSLADALIEVLHKDGLEDLLIMSAGPWKKYSCMSAYCVDAQKMADAANMKCWENDGYIRYFSLILFNLQIYY